MTRKTLINDNYKSDRRSNDDSYLSNDENVHKKTDWKESMKKSGQLTSEDPTYSDDIEGIRHEGSVSDRSSSPTTDEEMKVNILYRGMVYRIKGIKVICSIVAGIIILLTAMLLLGLWIIVGSKDNGELIWPWSETPNLELFSNETDADAMVTIPIMDLFEKSSAIGHTPTEAGEITKLSEKLFLNTSEEVEEALGHFQAVQPRPHTEAPSVERFSLPDDLYVEYEYYYPNDATVEYSLLHETLVNPPSGFLERNDESKSSIQQDDESTEFMRSHESQLNDASFDKPSESKTERENRFSQRISPIDNDKNIIPVNKVEVQEPVVYDESEYDSASFKNAEFTPVRKIGQLPLNEDEGFSDHRLIGENRPLERFSSAPHMRPTDHDPHFSIDEVAPFDEDLVNFSKMDTREDYEYKTSHERKEEYQIPPISVEAHRFDHTYEPHDEVDPHREVFLKKYDTSQIIFDDIHGTDPGFTRFVDDINHRSIAIPDSFARRFNLEGQHEHLPRFPGLLEVPLGSQQIPGTDQLSVPGTVHQIPHIRRAHIAAGFRPRITRQNSGVFSVRRGPAPLLHSRESIMQSMPHAHPSHNPRFPASYDTTRNQTNLLRLVVPIEVGRQPHFASKEAEPGGLAGTLRRMYKAASSLVPFSQSPKTGDAQSTGEFLRGLLKDSSAFDSVSRKMRAIFAQSLDRYNGLLSKNDRRPLSAFELYSLTYTFLDFWKFVFEKIGTLSGKDLSDLSRKVASIRDRDLEQYSTNSTSISIDKPSTVEDGSEIYEIETTLESKEMTREESTDSTPVSHFERHTSFALPALKTLLNFGTAYMQYNYAFDCLMLLYCKDLDSNSHDIGWNALTTNLKSVGLKVLTDKEGRETDTVSSVWQALTDWEPLHCDSLFPRCDGSKALEIVNEVANASRK
ncbi:hypothetical protein FHG87_004518 [Trinorchestia longiramus]|nr:hypothetical protein FHG87_004518 [Trinorchestia longiramus]